MIPQKVYDEVVVAGAGRPGSAELKQAVDQKLVDVGTVKDLVGCSDLVTNYGLDLGEAEVITLALELGADSVIIDEDKAWHVAKQFKDRFTTLALPFVLDMAQQSGFITSSFNALRECSLNGKYHIAGAVLRCWCKSHGITP
jgi:predicted nucleic acid-binding protein